MNPALLLLIIAGLSGQGGPGERRGGAFLGSPGYFDTFKMELLLDRLHETVDALERVNHLHQIASEPLTRRNSADKLRESVETVKPFLPEDKARELTGITGAMDSLKQFGDLQGLMQTMGPMLKMLTAPGNEASDE